MRVKPSVPIAFGVFIVYVAVFIGIAAAFGADYLKAFDDVENARPLVYGLAGGALLGIVAATAFGWWGPILRDDRPVRGWLRWVPLLILVAILVSMDYGNIGSYGGELMAWIVAGMLLVGFAEELAFRGIVLVSLRGPLTEFKAWFWSTLLFGLIHAANAFVGLPLFQSLPQVAMAFITGTSLYLIRRATGSIVPAMALHGLWDFATFTQGGDHLGGVGAMVMLAASVPIFIAFLVQRRLAFPAAGEAPAS